MSEFIMSEFEIKMLFGLLIAMIVVRVWKNTIWACLGMIAVTIGLIAYGGLHDWVALPLAIVMIWGIVGTITSSEVSWK